LFSQLNSPNYFSVYPPLCQFGFWLGATLSQSSIFGSVVVMKFYLFFFECGTIFLLPKLCTAFGIDKKNALIYALNPLVIIELCGNLHFEAVMIFFLLLSLWLFQFPEKFWLAVGAFALAVCGKLLPLLFLPLVIRRLGLWKGVLFSSAVFVITLLLFVPIIDVSVVANFLSSVKLYFQTFEFNASLYYIARFFGNQILEYDVVSKFGVMLALCSLVVVAAIALRHPIETLHVLSEKMLLSLAAYFFFATTVHAWYLATLVALSVFSRYRFAVVWSGMAAVSYATYQSVPYQEQFWLTAIEYAVVFGVLIFEWRQSSATT
jgi:alpha-1,6-mannosyltransferase